MPTLIFVLAIICLASVWAMMLLIKNLIYICQPNEVLIFSGSHRRIGSRQIGYRLVQGGRGIRIPLLERVDSLDLTNIPINIRVVGAYSKGGIPLTVEGVANVKIASSEPFLGNALERFLGKPKDGLVNVAKETLEGNLRGVLATLTPEEVNHDRVKFAQSLLHEADQDLQRLGLVLDTLKIQNVSDDRGYLDSLGRRQTAELQMRSRVAEAENKAAAAERDAKNSEDKQIARLEAQFATAQAEAQRRIVDAQTRRDALISEERASVTAAVAKAGAELAVQRARIEQVRLQLLADKIKPAEARREAMINAAKANAARIIEEGKATASSLEELGRTWAEAGDTARQILVAQKLGALMDTLMGTVAGGPVSGGIVDHLSVFDGRLATGGADLPVRAAIANEQLRQLLGVDLAGALKRLASATEAAPPPAPKTGGGDGPIPIGKTPPPRP